MDKSEEYKAHAVEALEAAVKTEGLSEKVALLNIAQRWLDLAVAVWTPNKMREQAPWRERPFSERN